MPGQLGAGRAGHRGLRGPQTHPRAFLNPGHRPHPSPPEGLPVVTPLWPPFETRPLPACFCPLSVSATGRSAGGAPGPALSHL